MIPRHNGIFSPEGGEGGGGGGSLLGANKGAEQQSEQSPGQQQAASNNPLPILGEDGRFSAGWYKGNADLEPFGKQLDKFTDPASMAKSYAHLEKQRMVPGEGAEESAVDAFRKANAIPATAGEYELKFPEDLPEGIQIDEDATNGYKELFHKLSLTPYQAQQLSEGHLALTAEMFKAMGAKQQDASMEGVTALQKEWGNKFDANLATAQKTFDALCTKSGVDPDSVPFTGDPTFAKLMATVSGLMGESSAIGAGGAGADLRSGKTEANDIMTNANHPDHKAFYDPSDPRHNEVSDRVARLNK